MSGIAILLELWRKNPNFSTKVLNSQDLFSTNFAVSAGVAASFASGGTLASRFLFGNVGSSIAYADAGANLADDFFTKLPSIYGNIYPTDGLKYVTKQYPNELKPVYSAFKPTAFGLCALRSLLMFYLPLLEPRPKEEDDFDLLDEPAEKIDLITPLKKSVKQIVRETTVVTTRRVLERIAVHYVSEQVAWKILKDASRSASRKAGRGMSSSDYFYSVSKTTFRGHILGCAAAWVVQVGIEIYNCLYSLISSEEADKVDKIERVQLLGKKIAGATIRCGTSLIFASVVAGIGSTLIHPSLGQRFGCVIGDLAGQVFVALMFISLECRE
ncbi:isopentenyl-diphosphate delta-isomerase [Thalictrum thalictroides]|uniref:Isopentenyl-diphosphate delta-isomerase n=1 Tax=Thalictrum thalictroides TaxID=46969 RepID=A0A7J6WJI3_THATH|nr:isopentenyl-diphosphate delta-isomerase [Thalictrum thalictroides]